MLAVILIILKHSAKETEDICGSDVVHRSRYRGSLWGKSSAPWESGHPLEREGFAFCAHFSRVTLRLGMIYKKQKISSRKLLKKKRMSNSLKLDLCISKAPK